MRLLPWYHQNSDLSNLKKVSESLWPSLLSELLPYHPSISRLVVWGWVLVWLAVWLAHICVRREFESRSRRKVCPRYLGAVVGLLCATTTQ